jgi:hypothetical protein
MLNFAASDAPTAPTATASARLPEQRSGSAQIAQIRLLHSRIESQIIGLQQIQEGLEQGAPRHIDLTAQLDGMFENSHDLAWLAVGLPARSLSEIVAKAALVTAWLERDPQDLTSSLVWSLCCDLQALDGR